MAKKFHICKWQKFCHVNGKNFSYDRKNLFRAGPKWIFFITEVCVTTFVSNIFLVRPSWFVTRHDRPMDKHAC